MIRRRTEAGCGWCAGPVDLVADLGTTPLADNYARSVMAAQELPRYPLDVARCTGCGLVQLNTVVPDAELWHADYAFYTGASPSSLAYFQAFVDDVVAELIRPGRPAAPLVVEIASNDGTFLKPFQRLGMDVLGVEPSAGPATDAHAAGIDTAQQMFTADLAMEIVGERGEADVVVASNVMAHVTDLHDFADGLRILVASDGFAVVEVQYLPDLLLRNGFDHFYHEHRFFFTVETLARVLAGVGLPPRRVQFTSAQGGSLRMWAGAVDGDGTYPLPAAARWREDPDGLVGASTWAALQTRIDVAGAAVRQAVRDERARGRTVYGVGATAKSCTLMHVAELGPDLVPLIYDRTPYKIGRFHPGTGIPVVEETLETVTGLDPVRVTLLALAHNYLPGLVRTYAPFLGAGGRMIVPLPAPVVI